MNILSRIRIFHALLACLAALSYLTGEAGFIHAWLGYGLAFVITMRLLWAFGGERQVGLMRFYPSFEGLVLNNAVTHPSISKSLILGIALNLILATATGIAMDNGKSIGLANTSVVSVAYADDEESAQVEIDAEEGMLAESHELFANLMLLFVGMHVAYLLVFKLPLVKFMVFWPKNSKK